MKKYIVLSVNDNPRYLYHIPLVCWAWRKFGWEPLIFFVGNRKNIVDFSLSPLQGNVLSLQSHEGYKSDTIAQVSRLYAACLFNGYLMTSDADMLPLSDYWQADPEVITTWGRDLTDYHYPICYIGMRSELWKVVMKLDSERYNSLIGRDLRKQANMWTLDQDLITERLNASGIALHMVNRDTDKKTGYPIGRVDRSAWHLNHDVFIDAHLFHDVHLDDRKFDKILQLLHLTWPDESFQWFVDYHKEFKKLAR